VAYAKAQRHPERRDQTVWQMFEAERHSLVPYAGRFDGFHAVPASVSKTCLVQFDKNKYSVSARAVGRPVWKSAPMPIGSSCVRTGVSLATTAAALDATRRCSIPGTTCRFWPANRVHEEWTAVQELGASRRTGAGAPWRMQHSGPQAFSSS
jgi:hypothetical protein